MDKISIVKSFFAFINKGVGEITPSDVEEWHNYLTQQGKKAATIYTRLSRLSSFYKWLLSNPHLTSYVKYNPVIQARPRCPRPYQSESVKSWSDEETKSIITIVEAAEGCSIDIEWKGAGREYQFTAEVGVTKDSLTIGTGYGTMPEAVCKAALSAINFLRNDK